MRPVQDDSDAPNGAVEDIKAHARVLQRRAEAGDAAALQRVRTARELKHLEQAELARSIQRSHCLGVVARELGFRDWEHARAVLTGQEMRDFGTLLYPSSCGGHQNIWSANYEEASSIRAEHGGYLLAYKHQFLIVEPHFIDSLGLDPEDPDWERIKRDWARPADLQARQRLYHRLVRNALANLQL
jgi:hypothetical protein